MNINRGGSSGSGSRGTGRSTRGRGRGHNGPPVQEPRGPMHGNGAPFIPGDAAAAGGGQGGVPEIVPPAVVPPAVVPPVVVPPVVWGAAQGGHIPGAGGGHIPAAGGGNGNGPVLAPLGRGGGLGRGAPPVHVAIEALLGGDGRRLMPVLNPHREEGALWFGSDNAPRRVIVAAIRRHFDGPWFNMSSVPNETIIQWWGEFIQAFYWEPQYGALVYSYWYNITAARLRDMVSKAKSSGERPYWISRSTWETMWVYWNSAEGKRRSRIAANNRLSNRDGFGPHAHTGGSRSFSQWREFMRQRDGTVPSMLRVLRETHRRADGSYVDSRALSIDQELQRLMNEVAEGTGSNSGDGSALTQVQEDELYMKVVQPTQNGHIFGLGSQQPVRERGESSSMAAGRIHLEQQVLCLQEQLGKVLEYMQRFMDAEEVPGQVNTTTPLTTATSPAHNDAEHVVNEGEDDANADADGANGEGNGEGTPA